MSIGQAIVRGYNFFVVAFLGIVGGSLVTELFLESEWLFRVDELLIIAIAALAIVWYLAGQHRLTRSPVPMLFAICALAAKVLGLVLEIKDAADVGDDIGIVQMLILFTIVAIVAYISMQSHILRLRMQEKTHEAGREMQATR